MKTIKEYILESFEEEEIINVAHHGCASVCVGGLIYYNETSAFHDKFEEEIWDLVYSQSEEMGYDNCLSFIASFNGSKDVGSLFQLKNLLCWYAVEYTCQQLVDESDARRGEE